MPVEHVGEKCTRDSPGYDGKECPKFDYAISPGELRFRQQLGKEPVLRGTKQRSLRAGQKDCGHFEVKVLAAESDNRQQHDRQLDYFCPDRDGSFTVPICKKASRHREKNEWE